jgi:hypothetical protein
VTVTAMRTALNDARFLVVWVYIHGRLADSLRGSIDSAIVNAIDERNSFL